jgi:hypothetical protein
LVFCVKKNLATILATQFFFFGPMESLSARKKIAASFNQDLFMMINLKMGERERRRKKLWNGSDAEWRKKQKEIMEWQ